MIQITTLGALSGLLISIGLILRRVPPAYGMMIGAFLGALIGLASLGDSVTLMINGVKGITPSVLRILAAGVLAGVLIESGGAGVIAEKIVDAVGEARAVIALILATMLLTAAGVFVDVAVITVAPIALAMGRIRDINTFAVGGLQRMSGVAIMLIGTGTLAGIIASSGLSNSLVEFLKASGLPAYLLAPLSGMMMSAATASTTAGTAVASNVFGPIIIALGIPPLGAAAMMHAGATVLDHMPHGSFFHATGGSVGMSISERLKALPWETLTGFSMAATSTLIYGILQF